MAAAALDPTVAALLAASNQATSAPDDQNQQIAASVTPQGGSRLSTYLRNIPAAAGGEFYRMYKGITGQQMDPLARAVMDQAQQAAPGVATATDIAATLPATMAAGTALPAAATRLGLPAITRLLGTAPGMGAAQGAIQGLLTADPGQHLQQGLLGVATGAALPFVGNKLSGLWRGLSRTPEAQTLLNRGANLTPGQMNPGGLYNRVEQALTGLPFVGGKIAQARAAGLPQVTRSILGDALAPGDALPTGVTNVNQLYDSAKQGFDSAYQQIHGFPMKPAVVNVSSPDVPLANAFQQVADKPRLGMTATQRQGLGQQLQDQLNEVISVAKRGGGLMSDHLQALRSAIRDAGRDVSPVDNASRATKGFWSDAEQKVTDALDSQLPPKVAAQLKTIDTQYGKLATVRQAITAAKDRPEGPTLEQLSTAIQGSTHPSTYAAGGGWNRGTTQAAKAVFGANTPLTGLHGAGTVAPAMHLIEGGLGLGAGAAGLAHPLGLAGAASGLGSLFSAYTKPGLRAAAGQLAPQKAIAGLLDSTNPQVRALLSLIGRGGLTQGLLGTQAGAQ